MNNFIQIIFYFFFLFLILSLSIEQLKKHFADIPNKRSSHKLIKPKSGGFIFGLNSLLAFFRSLDILFLISIPLSLVGLIDDKFNLPRYIRFISQIITIFLILLFSYDVSFFSIQYKFLLFPILILFGTSIINFTNFMDGIDGIVAGCFFVIFISGSILVSQSYIPICISLFVFILFNWHPSRIFMGDVGSTFLGAMLFTLLMQSKSLNIFFGIICMSSPLMMDALVCLIRRFISRKNIFSPHRDHLYQRLCDNNIKQSYIASIYILSTFIIAISYLFLGLLYALIIVFLIPFIGIYLDKKFALDYY